MTIDTAIRPQPVTLAEAESAINGAVDSVPENGGEDHIIIDGREIIFADADAHVLTITPADAAVLLSRNEKNRAIKLPNLNKIITDLTYGNFTYNGGSIVISVDGAVLDGQHRLAGVVKTGVSIVSVIATGVHPTAQGDMDSGKVRTLAENLELRGETSASQLAAVLAGIQSWERGERGVDSAAGLTTNNTSLAFLDSHPEMRALTSEAYLLATKITGLTGKAVAQLIWGFDKLSVEDRKDFFEKLSTGAGLHGSSPILALRNFLQKNAQSDAKVNPAHRFALTAKAWNQYRTGADMRLAFKSGGANPETFPEPI